MNYKVLPDAVRHCAWQMTHRHVRSDGKKRIERPRERPGRGQVPEFTEVNHVRDTQKAADTSELYDRLSLRLWMRTEFGVGWTLHGYTSGSSQVSIHLETPRRPAMGQESVEGNEWRVLEHVTASGGEAADKLRSVRHSGTSDQVWWPERLHGVLQTRRECILRSYEHGCMTPWTMKLHSQAEQVQPSKVSRQP